MNSDQELGFYQQFLNAGHALAEHLEFIILIAAAWLAFHSIFIFAIRTHRSLDRQSFFLRAFLTALLGYPFLEFAIAHSQRGLLIETGSFLTFVSLFATWQIYLIYLGIQRTNSIGVSKWWNLLISIPATIAFLYLVVLFFWKDKSSEHEDSQETDKTADVPDPGAAATELPPQKTAG